MVDGKIVSEYQELCNLSQIFHLLVVLDQIALLYGSNLPLPLQSCIKK